ncbi:MAG: hypothetical protein LBS19_08410 [Clostridiales bacterium]|jgi:putative aldouronate transport system substrate-binding protein|nr:hypothetical protein [Clostridiales bacterium]
MGKVLKMLLAVSLASVMAFTACTADGENTDAAASGGTVTLTGFMTSGSNQTAIDKATWFTTWLEENMGIKLQFTDAAGVAPSQIIQTMLASRDLPDMIQFGGQEGHGFASTAADVGLLLNLDEYKEYLPNIYGNPYYEQALAYSRDNLSGGKEGVYVIPLLIGKWNPSGNENTHLRWDIYKEIGMPEMPTLESMLDVLEQMIAVYPETEEGLSTFGFTGTQEFDGINGNFFVQHYSILLGRRIIPGFIEVDTSGGVDVAKPISAFDDNAQMIRILRWMNDAQKRGLLDPDAATQTFDEMSAKTTDGRAMLTHWAWDATGYNTPERTNADPPMGYAAVWTDDMQPPVRSDAWTGALETMGISADSDNIEEALKLLDFIYSFDGYDFMVNGPQGELWDLDEDGKRIRTEKGWDAFLLNRTETFMDGGGLVGDAMGIFGYGPVANYTVNPKYDQTINSAYWEQVLMYNPTNLIVDWREYHDGAADIYRWAVPQGRVNPTTPAFDMMAALPDDMTIKVNDIANMLNANSWRMIFAADDAEFNAIWEETKTNAEAIGLAEVQEFAQNAWVEALAKVAKYTPAE